MPSMSGTRPEFKYLAMLPGLEEEQLTEQLFLRTAAICEYTQVFKV